jgi:hypothetical protein
VTINKKLFETKGMKFQAHDAFSIYVKFKKIGHINPKVGDND